MPRSWNKTESIIQSWIVKCSSLEQVRVELLQGIEEMRKALAGVPIILKVTNS